MKKIIAITGSIASGKSTILKKLKQQISTFSVDNLQIDLYKPGNIIYKLVKDNYSQFIVNEFVDKKAIKNELLKDLNFKTKYQNQIISILIPFLKKKFNEHKRMLLVEIPYINKKEMLDLFDKIIILEANPETRIKRIMNRDSVDREDAIRWTGAEVENINIPNAIIINNDEGTDLNSLIDEVYKCLIL